jgi:intraflagellar transport protein 122
LDQRKINSTSRIRYFINIASEVLLKCCGQCGKFFLLDEYEFEFIQNKRCPFCNGEEKRSGRTKDIFDL